jgi:hypothetical protein
MQRFTARRLLIAASSSSSSRSISTRFPFQRRFPSPLLSRFSSSTAAQSVNSANSQQSANENRPLNSQQSANENKAETGEEGKLLTDKKTLAQLRLALSSSDAHKTAEIFKSLMTQGVQCTEDDLQQILSVLDKALRDVERKTGRSSTQPRNRLLSVQERVLQELEKRDSVQLTR